jgi:hypothetical protein
MSRRMMRAFQIYGRGNPIPIGKTKFYTDIVYREGGDENIPGTNIPRLHLANLSDRVRVGFEDEVNALAEAIRKHRDDDAADRRRCLHPPVIEEDAT